MNLWRKRSRNRRKPAGRRFEMPKIEFPRAGRIAGALVAIAALAVLLAFGLDQLRIAVEALVWVDRARVQRVWPDRIGIEIVEQQAAARWGDDGLLNTRGELFATGVR